MQLVTILNMARALGNGIMPCGVGGVERVEWWYTCALTYLLLCSDGLNLFMSPFLFALIILSKQERKRSVYGGVVGGGGVGVAVIGINQPITSCIHIQCITCCI